MADRIAHEDELRSLLGEAAPLVRAKVSDRLNDVTRRFVERSPFLCLATSGRDGTCDVSPRGDPAGFVRMPRRADSAPAGPTREPTRTL